MSNTAQVPVGAHGNNESSPDSPLDAAVDTWHALEQRAAHLLQLVAAELRLAASSGAWMGIMSIVAGGMLLSSWLALQATVGVLAWQNGVSLWVISLSMAGLNLLVAGLLAWIILRLSRYLSLPHLRAARKAAAVMDEVRS